MSTYRVGHHQPQNVYRGEQYIGVMFTAEDAALVVAVLNRTPIADRPRADADELMWLHPTCVDVTRLGEVSGTAWACGRDCPGSPPSPADSCTCPFMVGLDPACPVHQGRRARGPKPPPVGTDEHHYDVSCDDRPYCRIPEHHVAGVLP